MRTRLAIWFFGFGVILAAPGILSAQGTALDRAMNAGWTCADIFGAIHCFDPGDGQSQNTASINVRVFDYSGSFLGTEVLWRADLYAGQPCPQDQIIDLGGLVACHHYAQ